MNPVAPLEQGGKPWLCFASRGTYEWFMHPADAQHAITNGIIVGGKRLACSLTSTPFCPWIGAWQIVAKDESVNIRFIEGAEKQAA